MRRFNVPGARQDTTIGFSKGEKRKLLSLVAGSMIVGIAILVGLFKSQQSEPGPEASSDDYEFEEVVVAPEIDVQRIEALVSDADEAARVVLESEALDELQRVTRNLTTGHYVALGMRELTTDGVHTLLADPSAARGDAYRVRGRVEELRTRNRSEGEEHVMRLRLEPLDAPQPTFAYAVVQKTPTLLLEQDFVRLDGLFLKAFSDEDSDVSGSWLEGPLFVGREVVDSVPDVGRVTALDPAVFADVRDDSLTPEEGGMMPVPDQSLPFTPLWNLMAYARDLPADAVDWEAAPVLDTLSLKALMDDGTSHRLQPYRIPISRLQDARVKLAPENPARLERFTEGWIGSTTWSNVVKFMGPFEDEEAELADYVEARGFFLKHFSYTSSDRGIRVAPFFVLHSMDLIEPKPDPIFAKLVTWIFVGTIVAIVGFVILVARDGKRSRALQQDIVRRRQERRRKRALQGQGT